MDSINKYGKDDERNTLEIYQSSSKGIRMSAVVGGGVKNCTRVYNELKVERFVYKFCNTLYIRFVYLYQGYNADKLIAVAYTLRTY